MSDNTEIPLPEDAGTNGSQIAAVDSKAPAIPETPFPKNPLVEGVHSLADKNVRAFGGETTSVFVTSTIEHFHRENIELKKEIIILRQQLDTERTAHHGCEIEKTSIQVELNNELDNRKRRNIGIAAGTGLAGYAINLYGEKLILAACVVGIIGLGLIVLNWAPSTKGRAQ